MDGNFESGGFSSGSSMGDAQGNSGFDSASMDGFESAPQTGSVNSGGMTSMDYLKDGVDKGFYKVDEEGVFSVDDVMSEAQMKVEQEEVKDWDLMDIPGTAHDKLSTFSEMSDEEIDEVDKNVTSAAEAKTNPVESVTEPENEELTFEQKIIQIQAETLKLIAESMGKEVNKKELEELIKKLKELLKEAEGEKGSKKETLLTGALGVITIALAIAEGGYKKLEHEVKEVEK